MLINICNIDQGLPKGKFSFTKIGLGRFGKESGGKLGKLALLALG